MKKWSQEEEKALIEIMANNLFSTYEEVGNKLNRSARSIREKATKLGINKSVFKYITIKCKNCDCDILISQHNKEDLGRSFCNTSCAASYNNKRRKKEKKKCINCSKELNKQKKYCDNYCQLKYQYKKFIEDWKSGIKILYSEQISKYIKRYMLEKYENKCCECGWGKINKYTGNIPLEVEHIDGNPYNTIEDNLKLLCPNCHSLTKSYKGANRGKGRKKRIYKP